MHFCLYPVTNPSQDNAYTIADCNYKEKYHSKDITNYIKIPPKKLQNGG